MTAAWEISIVYDFEGLPGFETGWGFSAVITKDGFRILFDCGWNGHILRRNLGRMGITLADIDKVVISHAHWDHLSGLIEVLSEPLRSEPIEVFVPHSFSENLKNEISRKAQLNEVKGPIEVLPGVMSTGELGCDLKEQSLVIVDGGKGVVLTGCAHPGIDVILARVEEIASPSWLIGGLHDAKTTQLPASLDRLVLCHCTREKTAMMEAFPEKSALGGVGATYHP